MLASLTGRSDHRVQRFCALSGVPFFVLGFVGWLVLGPGPPPFNISGQQTVDFFVSHGVTKYLIGLTLFEIAFLLNLFWTLQLGVMLWRLEGRSGIITLVATGSALTIPVIMLLDTSFWAAAVYRAGSGGNPDVVQGLNDTAWFGAIFFWPVLLSFWPLVGYLIRATQGQPGALPSWIAWMGYALTPTQVLWLGGVFTKSGPFAMNGLLGYWVPLAAWGIDCLVLSVAMYRALGKWRGDDPAVAEPSASVVANA